MRAETYQINPEVVSEMYGDDARAIKSLGAIAANESGEPPMSTQEFVEQRGGPLDTDTGRNIDLDRCVFARVDQICKGYKEPEPQYRQYMLVERASV